jgi:RHS repeat-associated protein
VAELDGAGNVVSQFIYGTRANVPDYLIRNDTTYRIVADHLGSVRLVVKVTDGTVAQRVAYDEFGREVENTNPGFQRFGYAGGLTDGETALIRFGVRDYDPIAGRWTSQDVASFAGGSPNLYTYVLNDPVNIGDANGLWISPTCEGVRPLDDWGEGYYGASRDRGARLHAGVDYRGVAGAAVFAPLSGNLEVLGPQTIRITTRRDAQGRQYSVRLLHLDVDPCLRSGLIQEGAIIGSVEDLTRRYPGITPHVHLELYLIENGRTTRLDPTGFFRACDLSPGWV